MKIFSQDNHAGRTKEHGGFADSSGRRLAVLTSAFDASRISVIAGGTCEFSREHAAELWPVFKRFAETGRMAEADTNQINAGGGAEQRTVASMDASGAAPAFESKENPR
jgi:hypothetical protein